MQFLFDNLAAILVLGVVGIMLVGLSLTRAESSRDETRFYAHQTAQALFAEQVERDLTLAGIETPSGHSAIQTATADQFAFHGLVDDENGGLIEYRRIPVSTTGGVTLYRIERWTDGSLSGASSGSVTRFDLTPLGADGVTAVAASSARAISADIEWALPFEEDGPGAARQSMRRSVWSTVIRPVALQR